jgi:hypothetical protein
LRLDGVGRYRSGGLGRERGQAALLVLGVLAAALAGTLVLFGFGQALGARGKHQRAADLAAVSAAQVLRRRYSRLFEPAFFASGLPNPRHLSNAAYLALARAAARRGARRNGVAPGRLEVSFPGAGFAPTRIRVAVRGGAEVRRRRRSPSGPDRDRGARHRRARPGRRPRPARARRRRRLPRPAGV